ncbi:MAG: hypothetical protein ACYC9R_06390 [Nitrosotalea sp.]
MADELEVKTPDGEVPEEKSEEKVEDKKAPEYTDIEQRAIDQGWQPKEKWDGDPEDHRSAKEYLDRGELLGKIKTQSQQIREVKEMLNHLSVHNQKVYLAGYENAVRQLKQARLNALKEGEVEVVGQIEDRIEEHNRAIDTIKNTPVVRQQTEDQSPVYQDWLKSNSWYLADESMRHWANGMAIAFANKHKAEGVSEDQIYNHLTKEVREKFPGMFRKAGAPNPDGEGRQSNRGNTRSAGDEFEALLRDFNEDDARAARNLVKTGVLTKERYVADYKAIGGR